jgi:hypothetical protein
MDVYMPLRTMALVCAEHFEHETSCCNQSGQAAQATWKVTIPAAALPAITKVEHDDGSTTLPGGYLGA